MKSNDTVLLEQAYEQVFRNQFLKENDESNFKLRIDSYLEKALGGNDVINDLPKQNFYDAIENENLREDSWYIYARENGDNPRLLKILNIEDDKISIEDEQKHHVAGKYIAPNENESRYEKYLIYDYNEKTNYSSTNPIYPDTILIGPIEDEEKANNIENYIENIARRSRSMSQYYSDHPDASMD